MPDGSPRRLEFDFKKPDYVLVARLRAAKLRKLREIWRDDPSQLEHLKNYYKDHIADFINDWGQTYDPRNVANGLPAVIPFILFPKQRLLIDWMVARWRANDDGLCDKSREMGVSWIAVAVVAALCMLHKGFVGGFGSRKLEYVDKSGDPKCLFWKAREFISRVPPEFRAGWSRDGDAHCRITFPNTGSAITGEAGDNIGRGDRASIYVVDEAAYIEHPEEVDAALSQTTRCKIEVSSAHGMGNTFAKRRHTWIKTHPQRVFTFHWRDDPRKDDAWYKDQCGRLDPVVIAQEIDINYLASVEGILIPSAWVQAAVDAHVKLGFVPTGSRRAALDVADEGPDQNAFAACQGVVVTKTEEWSGDGSNLFRTVQRAFRLCGEQGTSTLTYDADGMGVGVRGDAERINADREAEGSAAVDIHPFHAAGKVQYPEREDVEGKKNEDHYANAKAQAWWRLRQRFERTYKAVEEGWTGFDPDELISLDSKMSDLTELIMELAQVIYGYSVIGKLHIIKAPKGMASPNRADALMMLYGKDVEAANANNLIVAEDMLSNAIAVPMPVLCDTVFAVVCAFTRPGRDLDGAAVVYFSHTMRPGYPAIVLDWDITEITSTLLDIWLPAIYTNMDALARVTKARMGAQGLWIKDETSGSVIKNRAERWGAVTVIESVLDDRSRALNVSGIVKDHEVQFCTEAYDKTTTFKGATKNHLLAQVSMFNPNATDVESMVLLNAFTHGVATAKGNVEGY